MRITRTEVKVIMNDFVSISNRLMHAAYYDYMDVLRRFISFIENNELILGFINYMRS